MIKARGHCRSDCGGLVWQTVYDSAVSLHAVVLGWLIQADSFGVISKVLGAAAISAFVLTAGQPTESRRY